MQVRGCTSDGLRSSDFELWTRLFGQPEPGKQWMADVKWKEAVTKALSEMALECGGDICNYYHRSDCYSRTLIVREALRKAEGIYRYKQKKLAYRASRKAKRRSDSGLGSQQKHPGSES